MSESFVARQVKGHGRGRLLGYPTINMEIPSDFRLPPGIYAVWVAIAGKRYMGALHFGPVPAFGQTEKSLEVFLLASTESEIHGLDTTKMLIRPVKRIRDVQTFKTTEDLVEQIKKDVEAVRACLSGITR